MARASSPRSFMFWSRSRGPREPGGTFWKLRLASGMRCTSYRGGEQGCGPRPPRRGQSRPQHQWLRVSGRPSVSTEGSPPRPPSPACEGGGRGRQGQAHLLAGRDGGGRGAGHIVEGGAAGGPWGAWGVTVASHIVDLTGQGGHVLHQSLAQPAAGRREDGSLRAPPRPGPAGGDDGDRSRGDMIPQAGARGPARRWPGGEGGTEPPAVAVTGTGRHWAPWGEVGRGTPRPQPPPTMAIGATQALLHGQKAGSPARVRVRPAQSGQAPPHRTAGPSHSAWGQPRLLVPSALRRERPGGPLGASSPPRASRKAPGLELHTDAPLHPRDLRPYTPPTSPWPPAPLAPHTLVHLGSHAGSPRGAPTSRPLSSSLHSVSSPGAAPLQDSMPCPLGRPPSSCRHHSAGSWPPSAGSWPPTAL